MLLPTYNERENLDVILDAILMAQPKFSILIIDDNSPDGTGAIADRRAAEDSRIDVLHRPGKEGLAKAYVAGFLRGLADTREFTHFFEMDADFSHDPRYLGDLLGACESGADLAVGSRYVLGGGTRGWPLSRKLLSRGGGVYARTVLGVDVKDLTAGFLCFRRSLLEQLALNSIATSGYGFQIELKYRTLQMDKTLKEIPIVFTERIRGTSKMSLGIAIEALMMVWTLRKSEPVSMGDR